MRRSFSSVRLALPGLLLACGVAAAQPEADETTTFKAETLGLRFETLGLERREPLGLAGRVENVAGATQGLAMKETETEIRIELSGDVLFDFDEANIRAEAEESLGKVAETISKYPKSVVRIEGYTDSKGSDSYNLKLSQQRADSVKAWLVKHGARAAVFSTKGWGEQKPVAPNENPDGSDNPEGRQKNRRVEILVKK